MCALLSSASSRSVTTRLTHTVCSTVAQRAQAARLAGQPDDCPSERGNFSRRSLASRLAGNRFDGGVLWQRVIKRLVDGLLTLSRPSWPTEKRLTSIDSKICLNLRPQQDSNLRTRLRRPCPAPPPHPL